MAGRNSVENIASVANTFHNAIAFEANESFTNGWAADPRFARDAWRCVLAARGENPEYTYRGQSAEYLVERMRF
jgi:hypothetical protein